MEKSTGKVQQEAAQIRAGAKKHYVLVHGICHGAWCWYKLSTILAAAGHRVTAVDLAACGVDARSIDDVSSFAEYSRPLTDVVGSLPQGEKVVLVGHSFGGVSIALAMDMFPEKIESAVFVAAFLPDCASPPSHIMEEHFKRRNGPGHLVDTRFGFKNGPDRPFTSMLFGPKCLASVLYNSCPPEDYTLATALVREGSLFLDDLSEKPPLSPERFGSVKKVYVTCSDDKAIPIEFQRWMVANNGGAIDVREIDGADHMAMLCKPLELAERLDPSA